MKKLLPLRAALCLLTLLIAPPCFAENEPSQRFDFWSLREGIEEKEAADPAFTATAYLEELRKLPDLTEYEQDSLTLVEQLELATPDRWSPDNEENKAAAEEVLKSIAEKAEATGGDLYAAAEEALFQIAESDYHRRGSEERLEHARKALNFWAAEPADDRSRRRYIWLAEEVIQQAPSSPEARDFVNQALLVAQTGEEKALLHFRLAWAHQRSNRSWKNTGRKQAEHHYRAAVINAPADAPYLDELLASAVSFFAERSETYVEAVEIAERYLETFGSSDSYRKSQVKQVLQEITSPAISFVGSGVAYYGRQSSIPLICRNVGELEVTIHRIDLDAYLNEDRYAYIPAPKGSTLIKSQKFSDISTEGYRKSWLSIGLKPNLDPGFYRASCVAGDIIRTTDFLVSKYAISVQASPLNALAYVCDLMTGDPVANLNVRLDALRWEHVNRSQKAILDETYEATTDENGLAWFELPKRKRKGSYELRAIAGGAQPAVAMTGRLSIDEESSRAPRTREIFCFTDRPAYRPGETVHWKAIIRDVAARELVIPAETDVEVEVTNSNRDTIIESRLRINANGTVSGSFEVPAFARLGGWQVVIRSSGAHGGASFAVEEYRLPEFWADINLDEDSPSMGERISGKVSVQYYSGEPMKGATVKTVIKERRIEEGTPLGAIRSWNSNDERPLKELEVTTDDKGEAHFSFETGIVESGKIEYQIEATVSDLANRMSTLEETVSVYPYNFTASLAPEHTVVREGKTVQIHVATRTAQGEPASLEGHLLISRRIGSADCNCDDVFERLAPIPVKTDETGHATTKVPHLSAGEYVAQWKSPDTLEPAKHTIFVGSPKTIYGDLEFEVIVDEWSEKALQATGEEFSRKFEAVPIHPVGTKAAILLLAREAYGRVLLTISDWKLRQALVLNLDTPATIVEVELKKEYGAILFIRAERFRDGRHLEATGRIMINHASEPLEVAVAPVGEVVSPGDDQSLEISVLSADGSPVKDAEIALSVFDDALSIYARSEPYDLRPQHFLAPAWGSWWFRLKHGSSLPAFYSLAPGFEEEDGETILLSPFLVTEEENVGYMATNSVAGTSLNTLIRDIPLSLEVIDREMIDDMQASPLAKSLDFSAGIFTEGSSPAPVQQRVDFRKSAFWTDRVVTDAEGKARVSFKVPDTLTAWRVEAYVVGKKADELGGGVGEFRTAVPVAGRLQMPRFLVEGDEAELSIVANNNTEEDLEMVLELDVEAPLEGQTEAEPVEVAAGASSKSSWRIEATAAGTSQVTTITVSEVYSDGMVMPLEVIEHGFAQQVNRPGKLGEAPQTVMLDLPQAHREGSVSLRVSLEAGLAPLMLRALPYLIEYPYTCTEQTVSRLVPVTLLLNRLSEEGADREALLQEVGFGSEEDYQVFRRKALDRLEELSGYAGWGWFSPIHQDDYMTAYALWGILLLAEGDLDKLEAELSGFNFRNDPFETLDDALSDWDGIADMQAWILFVTTQRLLASPGDQLTNAEVQTLERLSRSYREMQPAALAWTAMAAEHMGEERLAKDLLTRLEKLVTLSTEPGTSVETAHWGRGALSYYSWHDHPAESTAWAMMALAKIRPKSPLLDPALNWLVRERASGRWESTRTTMITLMAMEEVRQLRKERARATRVDVLVNGGNAGEATLGPDNRSYLMDAPTDLLRSGANKVELRSDGRTPVYFDVTLEYFDKSEPIQATESGIRVERSYYRVTHTPTLLAGPRTSFELLQDGAAVGTGDEIEVRLLIETGTDLDYLMIEDFKPAGFEALEINSGRGAPAKELVEAAPLEDARYSGREMWLYVEPRDKLRASFLHTLPQGIWEIRYRLRAETPGRFHALPAKAEAMYSPKTRGTSVEKLVRIEEVDD